MGREVGFQSVGFRTDAQSKPASHHCPYSASSCAASYSTSNLLYRAFLVGRDIAVHILIRQDTLRNLMVLNVLMVITSATVLISRSCKNSRGKKSILSVFLLLGSLQLQ